MKMYFICNVNGKNVCKNAIVFVHSAFIRAYQKDLFVFGNTPSVVLS